MWSVCLLIRSMSGLSGLEGASLWETTVGSHAFFNPQMDHQTGWR